MQGEWRKAREKCGVAVVDGTWGGVNNEQCIINEHFGKRSNNVSESAVFRINFLVIRRGLPMAFQRCAATPHRMPTDRVVAVNAPKIHVPSGKLALCLHEFFVCARNFEIR